MVAAVLNDSLVVCSWIEESQAAQAQPGDYSEDGHHPAWTALG